MEQRKLLRVLILLCCAFAYEIPAWVWSHAAEPKLSVSINPSTLMVDYGSSQSGDFHLILKSHESEETRNIAEVLLQARYMVHESQKRFARIVFSGNADVKLAASRTDQVMVTLKPASTVTVPFKAVNVDSFGTYSGTIDVLDLASAKRLKELSVTVLKAEPLFQLAIEELDSDGTIKLSPRFSGDTVFELTLNNTNGSLRTLSFAPLILRGPDGTLTAKPVCPVKLEAGGQALLKLDFGDVAMPSSGTYTGWLVISDQAVPQLKRHFRVELKGQSFFGLTITEQDDEGTIQLNAKSAKETVFELTLKNPVDGLRRTIDVEPAALRWQGETITTKPIKGIKLAAGGQASLVLKFNEATMPHRGAYAGWLVIKDQADPDLAKLFRLLLKGEYEPSKPFLGPFLAVFLGSIVSLSLSVLLPRSIRRLRIRRQLLTINRAIEELVSFGRVGKGRSTLMVRNMIEVDLARLRHLAGQISIFSARASDRFTEINNLLEQMTGNVEIVREIHRLRDMAWSRQSIPFSLRSAMAVELNAVEWDLVGGDRESAKSQLATVRQMVDDGSFMETYRACLSQKIVEHLPLPEKIPPDLTDAWILSLIEELRRYAHPATIPRDFFIDLDRKYAIVDLFLHGFGDLQCSHPDEAHEHQQKLLGLLKSGLKSETKLREAHDLVRELQTGISMDDVKQASAEKKGRILFEPSTATAGRLLRARFQFDDAGIEGEDDLTARLSYSWDFGDRTRLTRGKESIHFYGGEKKGGQCYKVKLIITSADPPLKTPYPEEPLEVHKAPRRSFDVTALETIAFFGTFVVAVLIGLNVQFESMTEFDSLQDYLAPFLWGFSLDQAKGGFLSYFDKLGTRQSTEAGST